MASREFNANIGPLVVSLEWRLTLFAVVFVPLMLSLGFWQIDRADEKRALAIRHAQRTAQPPLSLDDVADLLRQPSAKSASVGANAELTDLADRSLSFDGAFEPTHYVLLDNRLRDGRFGYELIALVQAGEITVPLNLGWIAGDAARQSLPSVSLPLGLRRFSGRVYVPSGDAYVLEDQSVPKDLPAVVQDYPAARWADALSRQLQSEVLPVMVRIDPRDPLAKRADWPVVNQSPEKHTGYAVQWFTMAAVLLIAFIWRSSNIGALLRGRPHNDSP